MRVFKLFYAILFFAFSFQLSAFSSLRAEEITILYTGETHAALYPCNCPIQPDGGVARRATLVKQMRQKFPQALLLDSGGFFAGGLSDEYNQNSPLDMTRTQVNLKAMELMGYDAAAIGDDEFNFGREFFEKNIAEGKINFLSSNLNSDKVSAYLIKEVAGIKIGIIGATTTLAREKTGGIEVVDPKASIQEAVKELEKQDVEIIVLLSHLGEAVDLEIIKEIKAIDIVIVGNSRLKQEPFDRSEEVLILRPNWQARQLGMITFTCENKRINDFDIKEIRASAEVADDPEILKILPDCFSDTNCRKEGYLGKCRNSGTQNASCEFVKANKVRLTVVTAKDCSLCKTEPIVSLLRRQFPGLEEAYLYYPDKKAQKFIKQFAIIGLPAYFLEKGVSSEKNFVQIEKNSEEKGEYYMLKPIFTGFSYLLNRKVERGALDLFISLFDENGAELIKNIKEFTPSIHFLATFNEGRFETKNGNREIEEYLRAVCVKKYYPERFMDYIGCRAEDIDSSWWDSCLAEADYAKIQTCARGNEGKELLQENISLNREFGIMFGPTYIVDNFLIFATQGAPSKEALRQMIYPSSQTESK